MFSGFSFPLLGPSRLPRSRWRLKACAQVDTHFSESFFHSMASILLTLLLAVSSASASWSDGLPLSRQHWAHICKHGWGQGCGGKLCHVLCMPYWVASPGCAVRVLRSFAGCFASFLLQLCLHFACLCMNSQFFIRTQAVDRLHKSGKSLVAPRPMPLKIWPSGVFGIIG